jgi:regulator of sigma E protease
MLYIILAIVLFGLLIAIHEFGHFSVAKLCGIQVNEFSIGMGPLLLHKQGKETMYSLRLFPIGGYCAMEGEDEESDNPRAFGNAVGWKKFLVLIAGSLYNFLTGLVILLCLYSGISTFATTTITGFMDGFPCQGETMLMEGDEILSIDGKAVLLSSDISTILSLEDRETVDIVVRRNGEKVKITDLPLVPREYQVDGETVVRYGLYFGVEEANLFARLRNGFYSSVNFVRMVWWSLEMLLNGSAGVGDLSGPVGIVNTMSQVGAASASVMDAILNLLYFAAFIAINLSVMNLLPIPALDGGRVFFLLLNGLLTLLFKRQIPAKYEQYVHMAGMVLLLGLMLVVALHDVYKIFV